MHSAGVVRRIDDLGRVSIPKELRQMYQWKHITESSLNNFITVIKTLQRQLDA